MVARGRGQGGVKRRGTRVPWRPGGLAFWLREANHRAHDREANYRAHDRANRRTGRRGGKSVKLAIAETAPRVIAEEAPAGWWLRMGRWLVGVLLIGPSVVTSWSFLSLLANATMEHQFWTTVAFWYFAIGVLLMSGWFVTHLLESLFLYLYVLGHELTHILFIRLFRGQVGAWDAKASGGFVTTDKTNIVIALAPYFVPFWSAAVVGLFAMLRLALEVLETPMPAVAEKVLYGLIGFTWAFHLLWTLWMIRRDQPDLRENGTFMSLMIIYLVNLLLLVGMLCGASENLSFRDFATSWVICAGEGIRMFEGLVEWLVALVQAPA